MSLFSNVLHRRPRINPTAVSRSASAKLASVVIETLEERRLLSASSGPAVVGFQTSNLTTKGQGTIVVDVTYASPAGIDETSFENSNLDVADAAGEDLPVTYVSATDNADGSVTAEYDVHKNNMGSNFNAADNGTYIVNVQADEVEDLNDNNFVPAGEAGSFNINIPGPVIQPTATLAPIVTVNAPAITDVLVSVTYRDADGINEATFDDTNISVTAPDGTALNTSFVNAIDNPDGSVTAVYDVSKGQHVQFTNADNGTYTISSNADEVLDNDGTQVVAGTLGTFNVNVAVTPAGTGPTATLQANDIVATGSLAVEKFTVTYQDNAGIATNTLDSSDILITGANGQTQTADFQSFTTNSDGSVTATYAVIIAGFGTGPLTPSEMDALDGLKGISVPTTSGNASPVITSGPAGLLGEYGPTQAWTYSELSGGNGTYTVTLQANQVSDVNGITAPSTTLGTFNVNLTPAPTGPQPLGPPVTLPGGSVAPVSTGSGSITSNSNGDDQLTARQEHAAHKARALHHRNKKHHKG